MKFYFARLFRSPSPRPAGKPDGFRPNLVGLEDRVTPANFVVLNTNDAGAGSLRQAVLDANGATGPDTITFDPAAFATAQTISLSGGQMTVSDVLTITGPAARVTVNSTAAQSATSRIFTSGATTLSISGMTFTGGNSTSLGGAFALSTGTLSLTNCEVSGNKTAGDGGAINISSTGTVNLTDTTISGNTAADDGGGLYFFSGGNLNVNRSTFSANAAGTGAAADGGVAYLYGAMAVTISNSTFSGNSAGRGGALSLRTATVNAAIRNSTFTLNTSPGTGTDTAGAIANPGGSANLKLDSVIVAQNTNANYPDMRSTVGVTINNSLIGIADGLTITGSGNKTGTAATPLDAKLNALADNGGATKTHSLQAASPALNAGSNPAGLSTDQRGPGAVRVDGAQADIGAFEEQVVGTPGATGAAANVTAAGGTSHTLTVTYADLLGTNKGIKASTILGNNNAVTVSGPGAFSAAAQFVSVDVAGDGTPRTVTYTITPPGGNWNDADNGTYTIAVNANQVLDLDGKAVPVGAVGAFTVTVAKTYVVTNINDAGTGSLRDALAQANASAGTVDNITFDPAVFNTTKTITLASELPVTDGVTLIGPGSGLLTVSGSSGVRVFNINSPSTNPFVFSGLTVANATTTTNGAGILIADETVTLTDVVVTGNTTSASGGGIAMSGAGNLTLNTSTVSGNKAGVDGGGIRSATTGVITLNDTTVSGNTAGDDGAGVYFFSGGTFVANRSTFSGNAAGTAADADGGVAYLYGAMTVTISNSTFSGNSAGRGGALSLRTATVNAAIRNSTFTLNTSPGTGTDTAGAIANPGGSASLNLVSTIVAKNTNANYPDMRSTVAVTVNNSFIGAADGLTITGSGNKSGTNANPLNPLLGTLAKNGGPTLTHVPLDGSPVLDGGSNPAGLSTDQRGSVRVVGPAADMGSVEVLPGAVVSITSPNATPTNATTLTFLVTFNQPTSGVTAANFGLTTTGTADGTIDAPTSNASGTVWTVTVSGVVGDGTIRLDMVSGAGVNPSLTNLPFTGGPVITVDHTAPRVTTIVRANPNPTNAGSVSFTATFSEAVTGVTKANFALNATGVTGASITGITPAAGPATVYTVTVNTGSGDGTLGLDTGSFAGVVDGVSNPMGGPPVTGQLYTLDRTAPTVASFVVAGGNPTNAATVDWTVTFSEPVSGLGKSNFAVTQGGTLAGAAVTNVAGGPAVYTVTASTGTGDGPLGLNLNSGPVTDAVGNALVVPVVGPAVTLDRVAPSLVSITRADADPTGGATAVDFTVVFNEPMAAVDKNTFVATLGGDATGSVSAVAGSGATYTVTVDGVSGIAGTLRLDATAAAGTTDLAGNALGALPFAGETYTVTAPGQVSSIATVGSGFSNAGSVSWTVAFNQPITGVTASNFSLVASGVSGAAITNVAGGPTVYTVTASTGTGDGSLRLDFTDTTGLNPVIVNGPFTGAAFTIDRTAPNVSGIALTGPTLTNAGTVTWNVTFDESVQNLGKGNFSLVPSGVSGAAVTSVTGSGKSYTVTATTGTGDGTLGLSLSTIATLTDLAGNPLAATSSGPAYTLDRTAPTVTTVTRNAATPTNDASVSWTVTFSEPVTGLTKANFALAQSGVTGSALVGVTGAGTTYTVTATTGTGDGTLGLRVNSAGGVFDLAGNAFAAVPVNGPAYTLDRTAPTTAKIALDAPSLTNADTVSWTVTYSEPVLGVSAANFALSPIGPAGAAILSVNGSGTTYVVTASVGTGDGTLGLDTDATTGVTDVAGNALGGQPVTGPEYVIDRTIPVLAGIARTGPALTNAGSVTWTVTFGEPVNGLSAKNFVLVASGVSGAAISGVSGSAAKYTVTATTGTGNGSLGLTLANSIGLADDAGNAVPGLPAAGPAYTLDRVKPTATVTALDTLSTNSSTVRYQVVFSEPVVGLTAANFALATNGLKAASVGAITGTGATYTVTVNTGAGSGTVGLGLVSTTGLSDAAGNAPVVPATGPTYTLDRGLPTVTITRAGVTPTTAGEVTFLVGFSEPVTGVTAASFVVVTDGGLNGAAVLGVSGGGATYSVRVGTGVGTGNLGLTLLANGIADAVGNPPVPASGPAFVIDRQPPLPALATTAADPLVSPLVPVTVTFSEPVTGFDLADVVVTNGTAQNLLAAAGGMIYTFEVVPAAAGLVTVEVPAGGAVDAAGNASQAAAPISRTFPPINPTPTLTSPAPAATNQPIPVTVTFSQSVSGFDASDLVVTNATVSAFTAGSSTFTFTLTPLADGPVGVSIPDGAAVNALGVPSVGGSLTRDFDGTAPAVTVGVAGTGSFPPQNVFVVRFSEPVTGFGSGSVRVGGTASGSPVVTVTTGTAFPGAVEGATYIVSVSGLTGPGTVTLTVPAGVASDPAGNSNAAAPAVATYTLTATGSLPGAIDTYAVSTGADGVVRVYDGATNATAYNVTPLAGATYLRVAQGDFNGDGVLDLVVGTGPGGPSAVRVLDGVTRAELFSVAPFEASFTGGVYVAAGDITGDGRAELVITPDQGGGPRVRVFDGAGFGVIADFFGIDDKEFRGGARAAVGDVNGDTIGDLVVAAGFEGGPRVAGYTGQSVVAGTPRRVFADFFAFEDTLRNGIFVGVGDLNGDGFAEVIAGAGPGGGPRVTAFDGRQLISNRRVEAANFFASGDTDNRGGVRLAVRNLDGDGRADLVIGSGEDAASRVTTILGKNVAPGVSPATAADFDPTPGFVGGVFVG